MAATTEAVERLLRGDAAAARALAARDVETWQVLLEHLLLQRPTAAPAPFVRAVLAEDASFAAWAARAARTAPEISSELTLSSRTLAERFGPWLLAGVRALFDAGDEVVLEGRAWDSLHDAPRRALRGELNDEDALADAEALLDDARRAGWSGEKLGGLCLVVHRWAVENERLARAEELARGAEDAFASAGAAARARFARRERAAAMLRSGRVLEALELLDTAWEGDLVLGANGGAFTSGGRELSPDAAAREELATVISWALPATPECVRALGGVAERSPDAAVAGAVWARFDRALALLFSGEHASRDLEVVVRQAKERALAATERRARLAGKKRGVAPQRS